MAKSKKKKEPERTRRKANAPKQLLLKVVVDAHRRVIAVADIPASPRAGQLLVRPVLGPGMVEYDLVVEADDFQTNARTILRSLHVEESGVVYRAHR